jgi:predicted AAA+ superfamily ATPase
VRALWRGGLPELIGLPDEAVPTVLNAYLHTYVERDTRSIGEIRDLSCFGRFVALCTALSGQEIHRAPFGHDIGIAPATVNKWLDVLKATFQRRESLAFSGKAIPRPRGRSPGGQQSALPLP